MRKVSLAFLFLFVVTPFGIASGNAQEDFKIVVGQDKTFTTFNHYESWFENCYENTPQISFCWDPDFTDYQIPSTQYAISENETASVLVIAQPGSYGDAYAVMLIKPTLDLAGYDPVDAGNLPIVVTFDFSYTIQASYPTASADGEFTVISFPPPTEGPWYDMIGHAAGESQGLRSMHVVRSYDAKLHDLMNGFGFLARCHAHGSLVDPSTGAECPSPSNGLAIVNLNSIRVQFTSGVPIWVNIDIKPNSYPNSINLGSNGTVPVAILSSDSFDATSVDPTTIVLAGAAVQLRGKGTPMASEEDINGDGLQDLLVHVSTEALALSEEDTKAILEGKTYPGISIRGGDTVRIVP